MKKLLSLIAVIALVTATCIMGIGTVAFAAEESPESDFLVYDGVLEEYIGDGGDVVIPASLGIKEIAERAFYQNSEITSLVIPEGVETIGGFAFYYCENIESLTLPYSLMEADQHCFTGLTSLTSVVIPGNLEIVAYGMFCNCPNLTELTISYGVKEIRCLAFQGTGMGKVIFPETVELICGGASFGHNKNPQLTTIEYYICNPDCEIGWGANGYDLDKKKAWTSQTSPWSHNQGDATYKIYVPENSEVYNFLNEKGADMLHAIDSGYGDGFRLIAKEESFFDEYNEWTKKNGTQKPSETGTTTGTDVDKTDDPTNGNGNSNKNNTTNNTNANQQGGTNTVVQQGSNNTALFIIIGVIGGLMVIAIVVVVILAATGKLFGTKKAAEPVAEDDEETAAIKAKIAAAKKAKELEALKAELAELEQSGNAEDNNTDNE